MLDSNFCDTPVNGGAGWQIENLTPINIFINPGDYGKLFLNSGGEFPFEDELRGFALIGMLAPVK
jgi:hypothetical protein